MKTGEMKIQSLYGSYSPTETKQKKSTGNFTSHD